MTPKAFGKLFCGVKNRKQKYLECVCPLTSGLKVTETDKKKKKRIKPKVREGGGLGSGLLC